MASQYAPSQNCCRTKYYKYNINGGQKKRAQVVFVVTTEMHTCCTMLSTSDAIVYFISGQVNLLQVGMKIHGQNCVDDFYVDI